MEAALVETPTIASPTEPFRGAIDDGVTGLLARSDDDWAESISRLLDDDDLRRRTGRAPRSRCLVALVTHVQGARYLELLGQALDLAGAQHRRSSWTPVAVDEPAASIELEHYPTRAAPLRFDEPEPDGLQRRERARRSIGRSLEDFGRVLRHDGVRSALRWSGAKLRALDTAATDLADHLVRRRTVAEGPLDDRAIALDVDDTLRGRARDSWTHRSMLSLVSIMLTFEQRV